MVERIFFMVDLLPFAVEDGPRALGALVAQVKKG